MIQNKWMVIANPNAGGGKMNALWSSISKALDNEEIEYDFLFTRRRYDAVELVIDSIRKGYRKFIAVGGDGTLSEVVNGFFFQSSEVPVKELLLAVIPAGSGNDWGRMYNISKDIEKAVLAIKEEKVAVQDVCKLDLYDAKVPRTRYMINISGLGFDANVVDSCNKMKEKGGRGRNIYVWACLRALLSTGYSHFKIVLDDKPFYDGDVFSIALGVGKYSGGGMLQVPNAKVDDGLVDISVIKKVLKPSIIPRLGKLFDGNIYDIEEVSFAQARKITIDSDQAQMIEVDGEIVGETPYTIEVLPLQLRVVVGSVNS